MLGDDAIPACGWCEDGITLWFDWLAMDAYDNRNWGPALEHVVFASMVISQLQQLSNPTRRAFYDLLFPSIGGVPTEVVSRTQALKPRTRAYLTCRKRWLKIQDLMI